MKKYPKGSHVEINLTPLGTCVAADTGETSRPDADYVVVMYIQGKRPNSDAVKLWEGQHIATAQHVREVKL